MLDMRKEVESKAAIVGLNLAKKGINTAPIMRVVAAIDISGSMDDEIRDGSVQKVFNQLLGLAFKFDDNGEIDVWQFDDRCDYLGTAGVNDYNSYCSRLRSRGGTAYSPFIADIVNRMFAEQVKSSGGFLGFGSKKEVIKDETPVLVLVITDGAPLSEGSSASTQYLRIAPVLRAAQSKPIYFQMVGINNQGEQFEVIRRLADDLPNVGFIKMNGFSQTDEQLYEELISDELVEWIKNTVKAPA